MRKTLQLGARKGRAEFGSKIRFVAVLTLAGSVSLLADASLALAYVDPILPGLLYQIGYFIVYGLLGVFAFFKPIKRLFKRSKEEDSSKPEA